MMEFRHYVSFAVTILALQLLLFILLQTLNWLFQFNARTKRRLNWCCYVLFNAILLSAPLHLFPDSFRVSALILALLLFSAFASIIIYVLRLSIGKYLNPIWLKLAYLGIFVGFILFAIHNAYSPIVRSYQVQFNKPMQPLRIGVVSDLHLGKLFGAKQLDELASIMQQQQVDLILLPGDIMDDNVNAYLAENMSSHLAQLKAPLGVYATMGNHDLLGDQQRIAQQIQQAGIHLLQDQRTLVANRFWLIGRNDELVQQRPALKQLLPTEDNLPIIVMDHRPSEITENAQLAIDMQVSGHTHNGQVFPANLIINKIYRLGYGYEKINQTHFFVTSGYGFWGVPFRLGSQSEILIIDIKGN